MTAPHCATASSGAACAVMILSWGLESQSAVVSGLLWGMEDRRKAGSGRKRGASERTSSGLQAAPSRGLIGIDLPYPYSPVLEAYIVMRPGRTSVRLRVFSPSKRWYPISCNAYLYISPLVAAPTAQRKRRRFNSIPEDTMVPLAKR